MHHYAERALDWPVGPFRQVALAASVFLPALAATLAAIRMQGEFLQLATRYRGMRNHLRVLRDRLARALDEVSQWRSLLYTHEIER